MKIVYSHGFGVEKDDRGWFTDIADAFPAHQHIMFDYNTMDRDKNLLTVTPLHDQAILLDERLEGADLLIAHSQGCVAASLAFVHAPKTIFLSAPVRFVDSTQKIKDMQTRPGTVLEDDGTLLYPRRDGSTTIIKEDYWQSRDGLEPISLYNTLSKKTDLHIIRATEDEVLGSIDFDGIDESIPIIDIESDHDYTGNTRGLLIELLKELV